MSGFFSSENKMADEGCGGSPWSHEKPMETDRVINWR